MVRKSITPIPLNTREPKKAMKISPERKGICGWPAGRVVMMETVCHSMTASIVAKKPAKPISHLSFLVMLPPPGLLLWFLLILDSLWRLDTSCRCSCGLWFCRRALCNSLQFVLC